MIYFRILQIKRNLQTSGIECEKDVIRETWHPVFRRHFLRRALSRCYDCRRGFYMYTQGLETEVMLRFLKWVILVK